MPTTHVEKQQKEFKLFNSIIYGTLCDLSVQYLSGIKYNEYLACSIENGVGGQCPPYAIY
ncbi:hypothetical protein [Chamaesiphon polymorphus]|uniref:Uncharacterized protein n=1 Tax=Chamaesiphon polymorphus CCALA 037 TaxID=2107692 RepID=A0A2T1GMP5_9CYAN|nr:hypothetical protein [Chamaesiphon polymorphus]PSB59179.1 hypothetical protein C7B77_01955 [Chamaesiphon polymorphus CCALA 037]